MYLIALIAAIWSARATYLTLSPATHDRVARSTAVITDFRRRASHNHRYLAEVVSAPAPEVIGAPQRWIVRLTRRNHRRVARARVEARAWMPETDGVSPLQPTVTYLGGGRYAI